MCRCVGSPFRTHSARSSSFIILSLCYRLFFLLLSLRAYERASFCASDERNDDATWARERNVYEMWKKRHTQFWRKWMEEKQKNQSRKVQGEFLGVSIENFFDFPIISILDFTTFPLHTLSLSRSNFLARRQRHEAYEKKRRVCIEQRTINFTFKFYRLDSTATPFSLPRSLIFFQISYRWENVNIREKREAFLRGWKVSALFFSLFFTAFPSSLSRRRFDGKGVEIGKPAFPPSLSEKLYHHLN